MYVNLGNDVAVRLKDVILICDYNAFVKSLPPQEESLIDTSPILAGKTPKSAVITDKKTYLSMINAETIAKRANDANEGYNIF